MRFYADQLNSSWQRMFHSYRMLFFVGISSLVAGCFMPAGQNGAANFSPSLPEFSDRSDADASLLPRASGRILGSGPMRVALLVPQSASGFGALAAENFTNAAMLALREFDSDVIQIVVKDTGGTPQGAARAAQEAVDEQAQVILGPMFSRAVPAVANIARPLGVPVLSFSSSTAVASNGVYVLGFAPEPGIERAIQYVASRGTRSFAALLPSNAFGNVSEAAFKQAVSRAGGRIVGVQRYAYNSDEPVAKARQVAELAAEGQIDGIFIPDAADVVPQIVGAIREAAPEAEDLVFIGSGQWDDPRIFRNPALIGADYPAPDRVGFDRFAQRYNSVFGKPPIRIASLAYDVSSLMVTLAKRFPEDWSTVQRLTDPNGFNGFVDGTFRLTENGEVERALAVYEVTRIGPRIVDSAKRSFVQAVSN